MLPQSPSKIYKALFRGHEENENYRCLSTFTSDENKKSFGTINMLNEETLAPKQTITFTLEDDAEIILLPLVGTIDFDGKNYINTEEIQILKGTKGRTFELKNPYENELINYLQIRLSVSPKTEKASVKKASVKKGFYFKTRNELSCIHENDNTKILIGMFDGRSEGVYSLQNTKNGILVYVIAGAFEFQNRLVEGRDALAIWQIDEVEFETLSDNAILLLIETTLQE